MLSSKPLLLALTLAGALHPQDGPDADVRIRVGERSVEFNIVMNLAFTDEIVDAPREERDFLHPLEYGALRSALVDYYREANRVEVDGVLVSPIDAGFEVQEADLDLLPLFPLAGARALVKVRLTLDYPVKSPPDEVLLHWGAYPPNRVLETQDGAPPLEITSHIRSGGAPQRVVFREDAPEWTWRRSEAPIVSFQEVPHPERPPGIRVPLLSSGLGVLALISVATLAFARGRSGRRGALVAALVFGLGAVVSARVLEVEFEVGAAPSKLDEQGALAIFRPLHANIYRAFDYADESDVYDALARSVEGDLLDDLYNQIYRGLVLQDQGGAVCEVESVEMLEAEVDAIGEDSFDVDALWRVHGAVYHWGHSHTRTNEYRARYQVREGKDGFRISGSQVLEQRRVESAPLPPPEPAEDGELEEF